MLVLILAACSSHFLESCTSFCFRADGHWVFGRNYDWDVAHAVVMVNHRGVAKRGFVTENAARWVSRYGSVTFNQYGREFPLGGMNEASLVVECMWLNATEYPHFDDRPQLHTLQWIQFQLDTADSVAAVVAGIDRFRISQYFAQPLHFLVADASGNAAVVEFLEGEARVYTGAELPVTVLANSTYRHSLALLNMLGSGEEASAFSHADLSLKRFVRAARGVSEWSEGEGLGAVAYAFGVLDEVAMKRTVFRVVYEPGGKRIHFLTRAHPSPRVVRMDAFEYECAGEVYFLDMATPTQGDVTSSFKTFSSADNQALIEKAFKETSFLKDTPREMLDKLAGFPDTLCCAEDAGD